MDGGSWMLAAGDMHGGGGGDTMIRCSWSDMATAELRHHEQEATTMMMSSRAMQQQLSQIYILMDMEEHDQYATDVAPAPAPAPSPSPSSSSFRSFSSAVTSRDDNSPFILAAAAAATSTTTTDASRRHHNHHQTEVSSHIPPGQAARRSSSSRSRGHGAATAAACAFRPYSRYLGPMKYLLRPGATTTTGGGGQRAFKNAISMLSKIHTARLEQYYQVMEMAARPSPATTGSGGGGDHNQQLQLQHVLSERKRREKLNDSFKALRDVLPPATKKDKASVLMRAKDYVNVLKARIAELEEKNRKLTESQLHAGDGDGHGEQDDDDRPDDDKIEVNIGRSAAAADGGTLDKCQELHLKIVLGSSSGCSAMDAVAGILQGLNEKRDASSSSGRCLLPRAMFRQQPDIRLQFKSSSCDEEILKESVIKVVKDVMQSETTRPFMASWSKKFP